MKYEIKQQKIKYRLRKAIYGTVTASMIYASSLTYAGVDARITTGFSRDESGNSTARRRRRGRR